MNLLTCNEDIRESAKHYIKEGNFVVPGVLKIVDGKKDSRLTKWKEDKYCLSDEKAVDEFFDKYKQTNLIAIRCDKLTVIDIDNHGGLTAMDQLKKFCKRIYGDDYAEEVYCTAMQYSLNGGIHLFFENDSDLKKMNLREMMGLDIDIQTSQTSLITMHPTNIDGKKYEMRCGEVQPFPFAVKEFFISLIKAKEKRRTMKFHRNMNRLETKCETVNEEAYIQAVLANLGTLSEGNRNDSLFRGCCAWIKKLSAENCFDLLSIVNEKHVSPSLDYLEIQTIFNQALAMKGI